MKKDNLKKGTQYVYGLDIGTRSIVGTVGYRQKDRFVVVCQETLEHESRAMIDGQIHDINTVADTIREVTDLLEERLGEPLKQVCIAAAGRVLKTVNVHVDMDLDGEKTIAKEDIYALDSLGIEKAYEVFHEEKGEENDIKFYCVGYSIIHYYMNGYPMNQLENHKAKDISADLIATFLPDDVVDGLYKAVELAGLEVSNLTLEPIAAIELAIPDMYRMLNIALIDVGAGTSDISITKDGSIIAYGMLPIAGDSLTETIARHCLVDFNTAETIKRGIGLKDTVEYKDIMGIPQTITKDEVLEVVSSDIDYMAKQAADKIKELNGNKPVSAVFVVGGGGKIATYTDKVAEYLGIQPERCAVRGEEVMTKIDFMDKNTVKDSVLVTPIGICMNFYEQSNNFIFVNFNDKRIKLYDNGHLAIVDAAIMAEFPNEDIFPKRGEALVFTLNGKPMTIRGARGESATVKLNGEDTDIHASIRSNDFITVIPSTAGEKATMVVSKLPEYDGTMIVKLNDGEISLPKLASVNGKLQSNYYQIEDNDIVELLDYYTVNQILEFIDEDPSKIVRIEVNHEEASLDTKVYNNFTLVYKLESDEISEADEDDKNDSIEETINTSIKTDSVSKIDSNEKIDLVNEMIAEANGEPLSALERAKENAQKTLDALQFERAEEGLKAMIQMAMGGGQSVSSISTTNSSNPSIVKPESGISQLKVEKSAKELYGNLQQNINRIKKGDSIVDVRADQIANDPIKKQEVTQESSVEKVVVQAEEAPIEPSIQIPPISYEMVNGKQLTKMHVLVNDKVVTLHGKTDYIYVDIFEFFEFDLSKPQGSSVETLINGRPANYTEMLSNGDRLEIFWKK